MSDYEPRININNLNQDPLAPRKQVNIPKTEINKNGGLKFDNDKPNMTYIPKEAMYEMARSFTYGAKKYGDDNYRQGLSVRRQVAAALRHIYQFLEEGDIDVESGEAKLKHIGSALASLAMAAYTVENKPEFDDRVCKKQQEQMREKKLIDEKKIMNDLNPYKYMSDSDVDDMYKKHKGD